jgi:hypothetical protein
MYCLDDELVAVQALDSALVSEDASSIELPHLVLLSPAAAALAMDVARGPALLLPGRDPPR